MDSAVTSAECRTPDGPVKLTVQVRSATASQRITFAFYSPNRQGVASRDRSRLRRARARGSASV